MVFSRALRLIGILVVLLGCTRPADRPDHLVLVVLDTLRADRLTVYGYPLETTPYLVQTRSEYLRFADVITPGPWTVPAHASLFTGLQPSDHRAQWGNLFLGEDTDTLAEVLADAGFCTAGLSSNPLVSHGTGLDQGFGDFEVVDEPWSERSASILERLDSRLERAHRDGCRLFLFLSFMDAHIPYNAARHGASFGAAGPGPVRSGTVKWSINAGERPLGAEERRQHAAAYDAAVRYLDDLVREIVDRLRRADLLDRTLVVLTSDHGEGLGTHPEIGHSISVWQEQLSVPLLVRFPDGRNGGEVVSERTSLTALMPTLLDWLGVERPLRLSRADDLWQAAPSPITAEYRSYFGESNRRMNVRVASRYPELAARTHHSHVLFCEQFKLVVDATGRRRFFDLQADPREKEDLGGEASVDLDRCWQRYRRLLGQGRFTPFSYEPAAESGRADLEPDLEALEALGYIQ